MGVIVAGMGPISTYRNMEETVDYNLIGGYRSHISNYYSHNPCDHVRLLHISIDYCHVDDSIHDHVRCDSRYDNGISGSRSQEISHYSFHNYGESVDVYGRSGYRFQNTPSPSHN